MSEGLEKLATLQTAEPQAPEASETPVQQEEVKLPEPQIDDLGRAYATGKCKTTAVARVWIKPGSGKITVCGKDLAVYFARPTQQMVVQQPLKLTERDSQFDVVCTVSGGGLGGQSRAVRHGIALALTRYEPALRSQLKQEGLLTVDARKVERKKYGFKKSRKRPQWKKR